MLYWEYYLMGIILLPGLIFAMVASIKVHTTYQKFSQVRCSKGYTADEACKKILNAKNMSDVQINHISGDLTDNYDPRSKTLNLSHSVSQSTSIAALGVMAHEVGHATQDAENYSLIKLRSALIVTSNITSTLLWPLVVLGLVFNFVLLDGVWGKIFIAAGVVFFGFSVIIALVTLPLETNASKRALKLLVDNGILDKTEVLGAKKVLSAAALTYVASLVVSMLNLARFLLVVIARNRE